MGERYVISDTHLGHNKIVQFKNNQGNIARLDLNNKPFESSDLHDEYFCDLINDNIRNKDIIYHLGDVAIARRGLKKLKGLPGRWKLASGNHDIFKMKDYAEYFEDIRAYFIFEKPEKRIIMSHIPLHDGCKIRWRGNVHGHLHHNQIMLENDIDPWYFNACPEVQSMMPISLDDIFKFYVKNSENIEKSRDIAREKYIGGI